MCALAWSRATYLLSLPQSCFPLTVAFLHREKVLLFTSGARFVFRDGKQLFSVATPGAAPLEQRRRPRAEARDQARAHIRPGLLRSGSGLLRSSLRAQRRVVIALESTGAEEVRSVRIYKSLRSFPGVCGFLRCAMFGQSSCPMIFQAWTSKSGHFAIDQK